MESSFSLRRSHRTNQGRARRLALEPLEQRLALIGQGFEVEAPPILGPRVPFSSDGVNAPGEWDVIEPLAFSSQGPDTPPLAVDPEDPNADTWVYSVVRVDNAGYAHLSMLHELAIPGSPPASGIADAITLINHSWVGYVGNNGGEPHAPDDDRVLTLSAVADGTSVTPRWEFVVDTDDDGTHDATAEQVGIEAALTVNTNDPETTIVTMEFQGGVNIIASDAEPFKPQGGPFGRTSPLTLGSLNDFTDSELVQKAGWLYRVDTVDGSTTATSDDVPESIAADADVERLNRNRVEVAIISTDNFDATTIDVGRIKVKVFDADGNFLGFVEMTSIKERDVDKDFDLDTVLSFDGKGNHWGNLFANPISWVECTADGQLEVIVIGAGPGGGFSGTT